MVARPADRVTYPEAWSILRALLSYGKLSRELSLETSGVVDVDAPMLQRMVSGKIVHPQSLLGDDQYLMLVLGLVLVRCKQECEVAQVLCAAEAFLRFHLGEQTGRFLAEGVFRDLGDRSQLSRHTLRAMLKRMILAW